MPHKSFAERLESASARLRKESDDDTAAKFINIITAIHEVAEVSHFDASRARFSLSGKEFSIDFDDPYARLWNAADESLLTIDLESCSRQHDYLDRIAAILAKATFNSEIS